MSDVPVYEIDLKKKYVLEVDAKYATSENIARIQAAIAKWLADPTQPFLILTNNMRLLKVEDIEAVEVQANEPL